MAYDNKKLKQNEFNEIVPQAYSPAIDDYEAVQSTHGGLHNVLYGPNGLPLSVVNNKLAVRATELEALMQGFSTDGKLEQVRQEIENSRNELALVKSELETIKQNQLSGDQKVTLSGTIVLLNVITARTTITAGSTVQVYSGNLEELAVKEISVQWYCLSSLDMRVRIHYYRNSNYTAAEYGIQNIEEVSNTHRSLGKWEGVDGPYFVVRLQNSSDKDVTLSSAHVVGRLG